MTPRTAGTLLALGACVWAAAKFAVQWHYHVGFETRRVKEAALLVETAPTDVDAIDATEDGCPPPPSPPPPPPSPPPSPPPPDVSSDPFSFGVNATVEDALLKACYVFPGGRLFACSACCEFRSAYDRETAPFFLTSSTTILSLQCTPRL